LPGDGGQGKTICCSAAMPIFKDISKLPEGQGFLTQSSSPDWVKEKTTLCLSSSVVNKNSWEKDIHHRGTENTESINFFLAGRRRPEKRIPLKNRKQFAENN